MTRIQTCTLTLALTALLTGQAMAAPAHSSATREQVQAELAEAIHAGAIIPGESGLKLNEQFPQNYPAQHKVAAKSRAQVQAELAEAVRTGNIRPDESGQKLNEQFPYSFSAQKNIAGKSREQVEAELAEAISIGQVDAYIEA